MVTSSVRFLGLFLTSLLVGTMFGVWLGFDPAALTASAYVEMQQNSIRALNVSMPVLGFVCIALTVVLAIVSRDDKTARYLLFAAALFLAVAGIITRFANQPINAVVMTWDPQAPPANWPALRDTWWEWHIRRTLAGVAALVCASIAALRGRIGEAQAMPPTLAKRDAA
jgi:uncharacterized membrane protein